MKPHGPFASGRGLLVLALAALVLGGCGGGKPAVSVPKRPPTPTTAPKPPVERLFAPTSFWNTPLPADAPLDPSSKLLVAELDRQIAEVEADSRGPWLGTQASSTPIYRVPADQPDVKVTLDSAIPMSPARAFAAVPVPKDAQPARGNDAHMTIWQPATDKLWELFKASKQADGWHARWGGAIRHLSDSPGYYTSSSWPGSRWYWGATATSLPVAGGVIQAAELERGEIDHVLALNILRVRAGEYSWPAQRTDGRDTGPQTIPEGARFRIDPAVDVDKLGLPPAVRAIAEAAQRYGLVVRDKSGTVSLYAEDPVALDHNPYPELFGSDYPSNMYKLISRLPWDHMQLVRMSLCHKRTQAQMRAARDFGTGGCRRSGD